MRLGKRQRKQQLGSATRRSRKRALQKKQGLLENPEPPWRKSVGVDQIRNWKSNLIAMVGKKDLNQLQILKQIQQMTHELELLKERCGPDGFKGPKGKMTAESKAVFKRAKAELFKRNKFILGPKQLQQGTRFLLTLMKPEEVLKQNRG